MKILIVVLLLLAGCQESDLKEGRDALASSSTPKNSQYVSIYDNGIETPSIETINQWYIEVTQCLGMDALHIIGAEVVTEMCVAVESWGYDCQYNGGGYIMFRNRDANSFILIDDESAHEEWVWKHEFIHFILWDNGIKDDAIHYEHKSDYWVCS